MIQNPVIEPVMVLPAGCRVVSRPEPDSPKPELHESDGEGTAGVPKRKEKVWYVLIERRETVVSDEFWTTQLKITRDWLFAHTKSWARELARKAQADGFVVVDIFPGTKAHISHKFGGLK